MPHDLDAEPSTKDLSAASCDTSWHSPQYAQCELRLTGLITNRGIQHIVTIIVAVSCIPGPLVRIVKPYGFYAWQFSYGIATE